MKLNHKDEYKEGSILDLETLIRPPQGAHRGAIMIWISPRISPEAR